MSNLDIASYNRSGQVFNACNQSGATVTLINTSTATGFILWNPYGSGKTGILVNATFAYSTVPTATAIVFLCQGIAVSQTAHTVTTPISVYAANGSGATGANALRASAANTTPNLPVYSRIIGYSPTTPATTGALTWEDNGEGQLLLVPGSYVQISYLGQAPVGVTSMTWIEV